MNRIDIESTDLNLLKVFEAIYDEGGAGRAALRLGVTQSAVSAALGRLRTLYADPLFVRTGRGLAPSLRARELRPVIGEALDKCRQSLALARPEAADFAGRSVTLGLSDDFEIALGRQAIGALAASAPGLRLIFRQTHSRLAADMLMAREADLVIASGGLASHALQRVTVGQGGYACLLDPASLAPGQVALTVDEFIRRRHVLVSSGGFIGVVDEVLHGLGLARRVQASTTHFAALAFLLRGSDSISTLPAHAARGLAAATGLRMLPCPLAMPGYAIEMGWRADALRDAAVAAVRRSVLGLLEAFDWMPSGTAIGETPVTAAADNAGHLRP